MLTLDSTGKVPKVKWNSDGYSFTLKQEAPAILTLGG
jgi:hypothetical protein